MREKLKKIFRVLFPKKLNEEDLFENKLKSNPEITSFVKKGAKYQLNLQNGLNIKIRGLNHSDYNVVNQIFNKEDYKILKDIFILNGFDKSNTVLIDAGANIGLATIYLLYHIKNLQVFCIEPSSENMRLCRFNIKDNFELNKIVLYNNALSEKPDQKYDLNRDFRDQKDWSISTVLVDSGNINGITLNEIISQNKLKEITILKIDIEGAEQFIFNSKSDLTFLNITKIISIEIHDEFEIRDSIQQILLNSNFIVFNSGELSIGINRNFV